MGGLGPILRYCTSPIPGAFPQSLTVGYMGAHAAFYGVGGVRMPPDPWESHKGPYSAKHGATHF